MKAESPKVSALHTEDSDDDGILITTKSPRKTEASSTANGTKTTKITSSKNRLRMLQDTGFSSDEEASNTISKNSSGEDFLHAQVDEDDDGADSEIEMMKARLRRYAKRKQLEKKIHQHPSNDTSVQEESIVDKSVTNVNDCSVETIFNTSAQDLEDLKKTLKRLANDDDDPTKPFTYGSLRSALKSQPDITTSTSPGLLEQKNIFETPSRVHPRQDKTSSSSGISTQPPHIFTSLLQNDFNPSSSSSLKNRNGISSHQHYLTVGSFLSGTGLTGSIGTTTGGGAQSSRAVLSALKALQDKIQRLEQERDGHLQQLSDLKACSRKKEAEHAAVEKKFSYDLSQAKESARAAYDMLREEKEAMKLDLVKTQETKKSIEKELNHFQALSNTLHIKAEELMKQMFSMEKQHERQLEETKQLEKQKQQEISNIQTDVFNLQQDKLSLQQEIKQIQKQRQNDMDQYQETKEKLEDAEKTIASISQLNEKLVARIWQENLTANQKEKKKKKTVIKKPSERFSSLTKFKSTASAAATTSSSRTSTSTTTTTGGSEKRVASSSTSSPLTWTRGNSSTSILESLLPPGPLSSTTIKQKKIVKKKTGTTTKKKTTKSSSTKAAVAAQVALNNMELLKDANLGKDVPFLLGTSTTPSFSLIGSVQDAMRQCDNTFARSNTILPVGNTREPTTPVKPTKAKKPMTLVAARKAKAAAAAAATSAATNVSAPSTPVTITTVQRTKLIPKAIKIPVATATYSSPSRQAHLMDDLSTAVESVEEEFALLNTQYKEIVSQMDDRSGNSADLSDALGPLLDQLEAKGKQVQLLKQVYQQASQSNINTVRRIIHSPDAVRRKTASLRLLNEYRQLERESKSPHTARPHTAGN